MTAPSSYDVRGGIRNWESALGNEWLGDCVIAAVEQLRKCHNVTSASTWRKILYRLGFRVPHEAYSIQIYTEYLATIGEKPGPTVGVDPQAFFVYAKAKGLIKDFGTVDVSNLDAIKQAMVDHRGCLLELDLTPDAYVAGSVPGARWLIGNGPNYVPSPKFEHAIALVEYNVSTYACVTWGFLVYLTPDFFAKCVQGCWWFE